MGIQQALIAAASIASASDPYWSQVKALLHFDGSSGSTTITDSKGIETWSASGGAAISTTQSKWGGASLLCGPSDSYVASSGTSALSPGTANFAIEFWWRPRSAAPSNYRTMFQGYSAGDMILQTNSPTVNTFAFYGDGATADMAETVGASFDVWHFYKLSRSGTALTLARDGSVTASATLASGRSLTIAAALLIGTGAGGGSIYGLDSWVDDFRITVGTNRPGSGMPTAAFPNM